MLYKQYHKSQTVAEAVSILMEPEKAVPIAGGTDLMVQLHSGRQQRSACWSISAGSLNSRRLCLEEASLVLGSALTYQDLIESAIIQRFMPLS